MVKNSVQIAKLLILRRDTIGEITVEMCFLVDWAAPVLVRVLPLLVLEELASPFLLTTLDSSPPGTETLFNIHLLLTSLLGHRPPLYPKIGWVSLCVAWIKILKMIFATILYHASCLLSGCCWLEDGEINSQSPSSHLVFSFILRMVFMRDVKHQ